MKTLCFLDSAGYLEAPFAGELPYSPGQQLLLEGTSAWRNKQVEIDHCLFTPQGPRASSTPRRITPATEVFGSYIQDERISLSSGKTSGNHLGTGFS